MKKKHTTEKSNKPMSIVGHSKFAVGRGKFLVGCGTFSVTWSGHMVYRTAYTLRGLTT